MLAYRWTWIMKPGGMRGGPELIKTFFGSHKWESAKINCYTPRWSPYFLVFEVVVENEEAHSKWSAEFRAMPGFDAFWDEWSTFAERRVNSECWNLTEVA
jgi:hypothetical protein